MGLNLLAAAIVAFLAFLFVGRQDVFIIPPETYTHVPESIEDPNRAIRTFSTALTYPTVGNAHSKNHVSNPAPFEDLLRHLHTSFPLVYNTLTVETVNQYSLLMTWPGTDVSLRPLLLVSHIDVVPAEDPENKWTHPPFSGAVDDEGFIWGRGAMDSKVSAVGILEAISQLIASGVPQPRRTVLIAIGHDEELTGTYGAREIAKLLQSRGIEAELCLDEGGFIVTDGLTAGGHQLLHGQFAGVATANKGSESWKIHISGEAGHSSLPPAPGKGTSVAARLARILTRLETEPTPTRFISPSVEFFKAMAPAVRWAPLRTAFRLADNRVINPILGQVLGQSGIKEISAMLRTTVAVVAVRTKGGAEQGAHNVMPQEAEIELNFRLLPNLENEHSSKSSGSSNNKSGEVEQYIDNLILKEAGHVWVEKMSTGYQPFLVSPSDCPNFDVVTTAIMETLSPKSASKGGQSSSSSLPPPLPVVPMLLVAGVDSRHYEEHNVAPGRVYRFNPLRIDKSKGDIERFHGVNERIKVEDYLDAVRFYMRFIKLAAGDASMQ